MLRLLRIEIIKLIYNKPVWILSLLYFLLLAVTAYINLKMEIGVGQNSMTLDKIGVLNFPLIWQYFTYMGAVFLPILGVLILNGISNEYAFKTIRQNFIDGLSKQEFLASKAMSAILFTVLSTVVLSVIILIIGSMKNTAESTFIEGTIYILVYMLNAFGVFSVFILAGILFRKTAFGILILFFLKVAEKILTAIEKFVLESNQLLFDNSFSEYLPLNSFSNLIAFPELHFEDAMTGGQLITYSQVQWQFVVSSIIYIILCYVISFFILNKRDYT